MEHTAAILLRRIPWSETSLIVTWLTERHGTLRTSARGARRAGSAFAGKLDLFYRAEISYAPSTRGDLHALREVAVAAPFDAGRAGGGGYYLAAYFAELSGLSAPAMHPAREIFDLLRRAVDHVQVKSATVAALHHFERELCRILGVFDSTGAHPAHEALASLLGVLPASRAAALRLLADQKNLSQHGRDPR